MTAVLLGVFAALTWSLHDLLARLFAASIGPFRMALRVVLAGALLLAPLVFWRDSLWAADRASLLFALALGVAYAFAMGGLFRAFSLAPVSIVGPFTAAYPAFVVVWGMLNGLQPTALQFFAMALALAGSLVVARTGPSDGGLNAVEKGKVGEVIFFCLLASLGFAAAIVLGQRASLGTGEIEATFLSRFTAAAVLTLFIWKEPRQGRPRPWAVSAIFAMAALDAAGLIAVNSAAALPGKEFAAMGISAYGAITVLLATLFLKEKVSPRQWLGTAIIMAGVGLLAWPS
jgi:drug/metabolite transporter (DMT)-like permease